MSPSVFAQDLATDQFEVILVVDGSTDGTLEALRDSILRAHFALLNCQTEASARPEIMEFKLPMAHG